MCGITGFLSFDQRFSASDLRAMTDAVSHRGPDAEGFFFDGTVGLGHRRLSILDLSASANQPMHSADGQHVIVFNGEVYNFREVAATYNIAPRTTSDTEIVLEAFAKDGMRSVDALNGMFAFAVYEKAHQTLWLCRDRLGIKPLFYFWDGTTFAFASELKSLLQLPIPKKRNEAAIPEFLHRGFVPAPHTIFQHIHKLPPGHWLKVSATGLEQKCYWSLTDKITERPLADEQTATTELERLLTESVRYQLISDVPIGTFLSGGIDSSLVSALAARQLSQPLNTFSIGFAEAKKNEAPFARAVASHLHTNHHEFIVSQAEAKNLVETMLDIYDEPYADSSGLPTMLVSALARKHVGVVLTGDGGDELFHGYGMYRWAHRLAQPWARLLRRPLAAALPVRRQSRYRKAGALFGYAAGSELASHVFSQEQGFFSSGELKKLLGTPLANGTGSASATLQHPYAASRRLSAPERQSLFDLALYLPDDLLTKVDRASMHYGLEARVPLLDHRVVEFALNLSPTLKYRGGTMKYLLKQVLYRHLPARLFDRPKQGFSIPLAGWLRHDLRYLLEDYLSDAVVLRHGYADSPTVKQMKKEFLSGNDYACNRLWTLMILHRGLEKNSP